MDASSTTWKDLSPPYATIVADPPWSYEGATDWQQQGGKTEFLPYSAMTVEEIAALPVGDLAMPGAHLYLWTTQRFLWDAREIAEAWGWNVRPGRVKVLSWCKEPMGVRLGGAFANSTEFILYCRRPVGAILHAARERAGLTRTEVFEQVYPGKRRNGMASNWELDLRFPDPEEWRLLAQILKLSPAESELAVEPNDAGSTWWQWKRGPHSAKPPAFLDLVERVSPAPRAELFARAQRLGWDSWGWGYEQAG